MASDELPLVVQVNGKVRAQMTMPADTDKEAMEKLALTDERVQKFIEGKNIVKIIAVPKKLVNIVVKD
jgi:leucyl-tRNA synthetase